MSCGGKSSIEWFFIPAKDENRRYKRKERLNPHCIDIKNIETFVTELDMLDMLDKLEYKVDANDFILYVGIDCM